MPSGRNNSTTKSHSINPMQHEPDNESTLAIAQRMNHAVNELARMSHDVALAKQIKDFSDDRKKRAFSVLVVEQTKKEQMSVAAAEHRARASDSWGAQLNDLGEQFKSALQVLEKHDATKTQYEAARSLLSLEKEKIRL